MLQVTYIWHDCFLVETDAADGTSIALLFDFWKDEHGDPARMPGALAALPRTIPLYVFISHGHKDHFNPLVFGWAAEFAEVHYIVSNDVSKRIRHIVSPTSVYTGPRVDAGRVVTLRRGEEWTDGRVAVRAFPSTDIGNSYMVETGGRLVFHAGDLNAWIWKDESTEAEVRKALGDWRACLRDITSWLDGRRVEVAMFPVDARIGRDFWTGAAEFVRAVDTATFIPMHFALGDAAERDRLRRAATDFRPYANPARGQYIALSAPGATWLTK